MSSNRLDFSLKGALRLLIARSLGTTKYEFFLLCVCVCVFLLLLFFLVLQVNMNLTIAEKEELFSFMVITINGVNRPITLQVICFSITGLQGSLSSLVITPLCILMLKKESYLMIRRSGKFHQLHYFIIVYGLLGLCLVFRSNKMVSLA